MKRAGRDCTCNNEVEAERVRTKQENTTRRALHSAATPIMGQVAHKNNKDRSQTGKANYVAQRKAHQSIAKRQDRKTPAEQRDHHEAIYGTK